MKKIISSLSVIALLAMTVIIGPVEEAGITITGVTTPSTIDTLTTVTLTFTPVTAITDTSTITVGLPAGFTGGASLTDADITVTGANITSSIESAFGATSFLSTLTTSAPVVDVVTITIGGGNKLTTPATASASTFNITTSVGDIGAVIISVGNSAQVSVNATVDPIFTFSVAAANSALGTLSTSAFSVTPVNVNLTYATNAKSGITINMVSVGLKNGTLATDNEIGETSIDATVPNVASTYYRYKTASGLNAATNIANATDGTAMTSPSAVVPSTTSPVSAITNVKVNAQISALTAAGSYGDTLTFVATPTF